MRSFMISLTFTQRVHWLYHLHTHEIDDSAEVSVAAHWVMYDKRGGIQPRLNRSNGVRESGAFAVHLVEVDEARNLRVTNEST